MCGVLRLLTLLHVTCMLGCVLTSHVVWSFILICVARWSWRAAWCVAVADPVAVADSVAVADPVAYHEHVRLHHI